MRRGVLAAAAAMLAAGPAAAQQAPLAAADFRAGTTASLARVCAPGAGDPARDLATGFCHGQFVAVGQLHRQLTWPFSQVLSRPLR